MVFFILQIRYQWLSLYNSRRWAMFCPSLQPSAVRWQNLKKGVEQQFLKKLASCGPGIEWPTPVARWTQKSLRGRSWLWRWVKRQETLRRRMARTRSTEEIWGQIYLFWQALQLPEGGIYIAHHHVTSKIESQNVVNKSALLPPKYKFFY